MEKNQNGTRDLDPRIYFILECSMLINEIDTIIELKSDLEYNQSRATFLRKIEEFIMPLIAEKDYKNLNAAILSFKKSLKSKKEEIQEDALFYKKDVSLKNERLKRFISSLYDMYRRLAVKNKFSWHQVPAIKYDVINYLDDYYPENSNSNQEELIEKKLNWTGTAGEFAAIIDLLIDKGFIEGISQKNNKANLCLKLFHIRNQKNGEEISPRTLAECFGKDKHNFLPNDIKIPNSITYGKEQTTVRKQNGNRTEKGD